MRKLPALQLTVKSGGFVCGVLHEGARGPEAGQWFWFVTGPQARVPGARESDRGWTPRLEAARAKEHAAAWGRWRQWAGLVQVRPLTCACPGGWPLVAFQGPVAVDASRLACRKAGSGSICRATIWMRTAAAIRD